MEVWPASDGGGGAEPPRGNFPTLVLQRLIGRDGKTIYQRDLEGTKKAKRKSRQESESGYKIILLEF